MRTQWASLDDLTDEVRRCAQERREFSEVEALVRKLVILQDRIQTPAVSVVGREDLEASLREGGILLEDVAVDPDALRGHLKAVLSLLDDRREHLMPLFDVLADYFLENLEGMKRELPEDPGKWASRLNEAFGIPEDTAQLLLWAVLHPFFRSHARALLGDADTALWSEGFCPVCGARPQFAKLREADGARIIECWLCATQWQFPRIKCPFCSSEDQEMLRFFYLEGDEGLRMQVCDECGRYFKVVDTREMKREVVLSVQNLATLHCDAVAKSEGYRPGSGLRLVPEMGDEAPDTTKRGENS